MGISSIPLNDGTQVIVDDEDCAWAEQWKWTHSCERKERGLVGYALRGGSSGGKAWRRYMHREIAVRAGVLLSYDDSRQIDHLNRDHFDNRRDNLKAVSHGENSANRAGWGKSGIKGVREDRPGRWSAEIRRCGERRCRHGFRSVAEAVAWREKQRQEMAAGY